MCGEVASVQAVTSNALRGLAVEDTAAVILTLANGAIVTVNLSDSIPSPYSWDLNAAEEPSFPVNGKDAYLIGGTAASLALPSLCSWSDGSERGWMKPLDKQKRVVTQENPYVRQCTHFLCVVRGEEAPLVTRRVDAQPNGLCSDQRSGPHRVTGCRRFSLGRERPSKHRPTHDSSGSQVWLVRRA